MKTFAGIVVLVKFGAVEFRQPKIIRGKMPRHPVKDHPKTSSMRRMNKVQEIIARTEATRWRIEPGRLIAPTAIKRVFIDRHKLEMGEPHPFRVRDQLVGQLPIAEPKVVIRMAAPGAEMHFIDTDWRIEVIGVFTLFALGFLSRQAANQ